MRLQVKIKPQSKQTKVIKLGDLNYQVYLTAPAKNNKANRQLIKILAAYFKTPKSSVIIKKGLKNKRKSILVIK